MPILNDKQQLQLLQKIPKSFKRSSSFQHVPVYFVDSLYQKTAPRKSLILPKLLSAGWFETIIWVLSSDATCDTMYLQGITDTTANNRLLHKVIWVTKLSGLVQLVSSSCYIISQLTTPMVRKHKTCHILTFEYWCLLFLRKDHPGGPGNDQLN